MRTPRGRSPWPLAVALICLSFSEASALRAADQIQEWLKEADRSRDQGQPAKAIPLYAQALDAARKQRGEDTVYTASIMRALAVAYYDADKYAEAEPLLRRSLTVYEARRGKDDLQTGSVVNDLAKLCQAMARKDEAEKLFLRSLALLKAKVGENHLNTAMVMGNLAVLYHDQGRYADAEPLYRRSNEIRQAKLGNHITTAWGLNNLGGLYKDMARYRDAEVLYKQALEMFETTSGKDHTATAGACHSLGLLYLDQGKYVEAEPFLLRSLQIYEAKSGKDSLAAARSVNSLASLYNSMGRAEDAEPFYRRSLAIREKVLGDHPQTALALNNLAHFCQQLGQYAESELLYRRALAIFESKSGKEHLDTAWTLTHLGGLYHGIGWYREAEPLMRRSLEIREAKLGKDHPDTANALSNLAVLYADQQRYQESEPLQRRCLQIREAKLGKDHLDVAHSLRNLAMLCSRTGRHEEAESLASRALQMHEAKFGKDHLSTADSLAFLASIYFSAERYADAEPLYRRVLELREKKLGRSHPETTDALESLAGLYEASGRNADARADYDTARKGIKEYAMSMLPALSSRSRNAYLHIAYAAHFKNTLSLALRQGASDVATAEASAAWLAYGKGLSRETQALAAQLQSHQEADARGPADDLRRVRQRLARWKLQAPAPGGEAVRQQEIDRLEAKDHELTLTLQKLGARTTPGAGKSDWAELADIRAGLGEQGVLIDLIRMETVDPKTYKLNPACYVAWLTPRRGSVRVIDLGEAAPIDALVTKVKDELATARQTLREVGEADAEKSLRSKARALAERIVDPLLAVEEVKTAKHWTLSPDGDLWLVPWAALPLPDGKYLVENYVIRLVTAGRDVAVERQASPPVKPAAPLIVADPDFDLTRGESAPAGSDSGRPANSLLSAELKLGSVRRLPATAAEAELVAPKIEALLKSVPRIQTGEQALESVVKATHHPQILMLSTHGFFLPQRPAKTKEADPKVDLNASRGVALEAGKLLEEPLLRCGLLLAGCNHPPANPADPTDDGVLTGLEVAALDLRGCQMVVLSACETGLGDVRQGEGVAGLRQAFQVAGAEAVLATLWKVPDRETAQLMIGFFDRLSAGQGRAAALAETQRELIRHRRERNEAAHPYYWGAFTLTGSKGPR